MGASSGNAADRVEIQLAMPGAEDAEAKSLRMAAALKAIDRATNDAARGAKTFGAALDDTKKKAAQTSDALASTAQGAQRIAGTLNVLGATVTRVSPEMGGFVQAVGRSGAAITQMTALLSGGAGIAAGGLLAAIGLLSEHMRNTAAAAKEMEDAQKAANKELEKTLALADKAAVAGLSNDTAATQGRNATIAEMQKAIAERSKEIAATASSVAPGSGLSDKEFAAANKRRRALIAENERATRYIKKLRDQNADELLQTQQKRDLERVNNAEEVADAAGEIHEGTGTRAYGGRLGTNAANFRRALDAGDRGQRALDERKRMLDSASAAIKVSEQRAAAEVAIEKQQSDQKLMIKRQHEAAAAALRKQYAEKDKKLDEEAQRRNEKMRAVGMEAFSAVGASGIQALGKLAQGQKISGKQIIAMIGDQMVALGTKNLFEGLAMSANPLTPGLGGPLIAAALAEIAAGVGLGAASRGASAGGGASGGGREGFYNPGGKDIWRSSAIAPSARLDDSGRSGNTTNVVYLSSVITPSAQDAINIKRALDHGRRVGVA